MQPVTHGETHEEAFRNAQEVLELLIESALEEGKLLPQLRQLFQAEGERSSTSGYVGWVEQGETQHSQGLRVGFHSSTQPTICDARFIEICDEST